MTTASGRLQDLQRRIYVKAKAETTWRFWGLYVHVCKRETLRDAYDMAKSNAGAPGSDGVTFEAIETAGVELFLAHLQHDRQARTYRPLRSRKVAIPKDNGRKVRILSIPAIRDRVVQGALKLILEPIFEADFHDGSYGYRPRLMLKATGTKGVPQGGVISPLLANIFLTEVDGMLERAKEVTRSGQYTYVEYARFADDLVVLVDGYRRHGWLLQAVHRRLREEFAKLDLQLNEDKSRIVDLSQGERFGFLGFGFRRVRSLRGVWRPQYTPKLKQRTALLHKLQEVFRRFQSQPVTRVLTLITPILRGWVNYFRIGHAARSFAYVQDWVERKVRHHLMRAKKRRGFGWKRWSRAWLYTTLGLYQDYRIRPVGHA